VNDVIAGRKHPEDDHHEDCEPIAENTVTAQQFNREMRKDIRSSGQFSFAIPQMFITVIFDIRGLRRSGASPEYFIGPILNAVMSEKFAYIRANVTEKLRNVKHRRLFLCKVYELQM